MFVVAGAAKLADLAGSREALEGFGVPVRVVRPLAVALPVAELMIAGALLPVVLAPWGAVAACALLSAFVVVIALNLAHGRRTDCHCFGGLHSAPAGPLALVRNTLLALAAGLVAVHGFAGSPASATAWVDRLGPGERVGLLVGAPALVLVAGMAWVCVVLLRRYGRLLLRLEEFEGVVSAGGGATEDPGLAMMEPAPEFSARSVTGEPISLSSLRAEGRLTLLVFADPACGPCRRTLAAVAGWQEDYYERLTIAVITSASPAEASELRDEYRLEQVLVDSDREIAKAYRIPGTPAGMLLYGDGRVARPVALGAPRLEALLDLAMTEPAPPAPSRNGAPVAAAAGAAGLALAGVAVGAPSARAASNDPELQSISNVLDAAAPHLDAIEKASATAIKALAPNARVIGVEPELAADARESLAKGEIVRWDGALTTRTMADGLRVEHLGWLPFLHLRRFMDEIVTVTEDQMADAMRQLATRARLVVEASGAAGMAAHLSGAAPQPDGDDQRVIVISGGNVDPAAFADILRG